jgi:uncharacterized membrane protein YfcA
MNNVMNDMMKYILTAILGIVSGILGGCLGLGTTTLAVPGFLLLGLVPNSKTAIGTALVASPANWPAVYRYHKNGYSNLTLGLIYVLFYLSFSYFGAKLNDAVSEAVTNYLVSGVHCLIAVYFLYRAVSPNKKI